MKRSPVFDQMVTDAAFTAHEARLHETDLFGMQRWDVDFDAGTFTFGGSGGTTFGVQLLGSTAPGPRSWLWAWANPQDFESTVLRAANSTRDMGAHYGVPELTTGEIGFDAGDVEGLGLGYELSLPARLASGLWFGYAGPFGGGSRLWVLLEGLTLPVPTIARTTRVFMEAISMMTISDHRRAIASYATQRQAPWDGEHLSVSDGVIQIVFDEQGRIGSVQASSGS